MNTKTAKKEFRKNQRNNHRNKLMVNNQKKIIKKLKNLNLLSTEKIQEEFPKYMSITDKIAKKRNIIHPKTASRAISRMSKRIKLHIEKTQDKK